MAQVPSSPAPPWSDLPPELLGLVFLLLPKRADRAFFTAVCRAWCSVARQCRLPPPSPVPWLVLPDCSATSFPRGETFQLPDGVRHHSSCGEWLLLSHRDSSCFLMNHFTKATLPLPSLSSYNYYQEPVVVADVIDLDMPWTWMDHKDTGEISVLSLVVCSTRLIAAIVAVKTLGTIALCRPGAGAWSVNADVECSQLSDMVFLQGKIYALDRTTGAVDLIAIDVVDEYDNEPRVSRIECLIEGISLPHQQQFICAPYLLESHGTLLMICRTASKKIERGSIILVAASSKFVVFEADLERHMWAEMRTLGNDQALFLGRGCSRAVRVSPYDLSRDCILYLHDSINWFWNLKKAASSCELYDMKDGKIYSPLPFVSWKSGKVPATWIFAQGETDNAANSRSQEIVEPEVDL